jgi:hypothetical protein
MEKLNHSEISQLVKDTEDLAINLGADATEMLKIASVSATAKDTIDEVISKTKASTILSNLSGIDGGEITKGVLAVTNQFEEFSNVTDETMLNLSDKIIGVAKNLSVDFNDAVGGSLEGVKILGSVAEEMGMSFDATLANISGVAEMTGQSFGEVSNGLKTIKLIVA